MYLFNKQLALFKRGTCGTDKAGHYVIAAWHWKDSITWRWLLWWHPFHNYNLRTRLMGTFFFATQKNMFINNLTKKANK